MIWGCGLRCTCGQQGGGVYALPLGRGQRSGPVQWHGVTQEKSGGARAVATVGSQGTGVRSKANAGAVSLHVRASNKGRVSQDARRRHAGQRHRRVGSYVSPGRGAVVLEQRLQRWRWTVLSSSSRTMVSTSARTPFFAAAKGNWRDDNRVTNLELPPTTTTATSRPP